MSETQNINTSPFDDLIPVIGLSHKKYRCLFSPFLFELVSVKIIRGKTVVKNLLPVGCSILPSVFPTLCGVPGNVLITTGFH